MGTLLTYQNNRIDTKVVHNVSYTAVEADLNEVNFYDWNGFRLYSYTHTEAALLTELPPLPGHSGMICEGWNWTFEEFTAQLNMGGDINIGAIYRTADNMTHIKCLPTVLYPIAKINLTPTVANAVTVHWGDGSSDTWSSAATELKSHTYSNVGDDSVFDIKIECASGTYSFESIGGSSTNNIQLVYEEIKMSDHVTGLGTGAFYALTSLKNISLSKTVQTFTNGSLFRNCYGLRAINIPRKIGSASIQFTSYAFEQCYALKTICLPGNFYRTAGSYAWRNCCSLRSITIPAGTASLYQYFCYGCESLKTVYIPNTMSSISNYGFQNCYSLETVVLPSSVTSIGTSAFNSCSILKRVEMPGVTTLGNNCFNSCGCLHELHLPATLTTIGTGCFADSRIYKLYCHRTTPPTMSDASLVSRDGLVIYVPEGYLTAYQTADYWSTYASKMIEYTY